MPLFNIFLSSMYLENQKVKIKQESKATCLTGNWVQNTHLKGRFSLFFSRPVRNLYHPLHVGKQRRYNTHLKVKTKPFQFRHKLQKERNYQRKSIHTLPNTNSPFQESLKERNKLQVSLAIGISTAFLRSSFIHERWY